MSKGKVSKVSNKKSSGGIVESHKVVHGAYSRKTRKQMEVAKKYKINRPSMLQELRYNKTATPYCKIEYIHGKNHEVVEFDGDGQVHGTEWIEKTKGHAVDRHYRLQYFISGMFWAAAIAVIVWSFIR